MNTKKLTDLRLRDVLPLMFSKKMFSKLVSVLMLLVAATGFAAHPYPLEYWALREYVSGVELSPEGDHLALLKISTKEADPVLEVYDTSDLSKEPFRVNADPMEIIGFNWLSNSVIGFTARQKVRDRIEGFNEGVYEYKYALLDIESEELGSYAQDSQPIVTNRLPSKPDHVIVAYENYDRDGPAGKIQQAFRPQAYWEMNIKTGAKKLLIRGKLRLGAIRFSADGEPRLAQGYDERSGYYIWYHREPGESDWQEIYRQHIDEFEYFGVGALQEDNPGYLYVYANNGENTEGLWSFGIETKSIVEPIYKRSDVDIGNLVYHSNYWANPDVVVGVMWSKDKRHIEYWDAEEAAIQRQLESVIPNAHRLDFNRSRDGQTILISNRGPRDPGTYYLLKDGKLEVVGSQNPLLEADQLADVRYLTYEGRDGRMIPAYITVPNSEPPYPLVVMPHGGPFVGEVVDYDEWGQMLANNGYLVLQPQYRGSRNYGMEHYRSAFIDGGQGGYKMQDDKDDGALHLVEEGLADRNRIAMYGWSYGGYAALVAAARDPQIYQCVIAGAAVTDRNQQLNYYRFLLEGAPGIEQIRMWDDSISPIKEVSKVNVPLLLIHGDVDQRVPPLHAEKYLKELERHEKNYQYVALEGADHFYNTLFYRHQLLLYESMIGFLQDDCGPDGL